MNIDKRFQECNKLEQIWRYRFYVPIPFLWIYYSLLGGQKVYIDKFEDGEIIHTDEYNKIGGNKLWKILIGVQQGKMKWYWTSEEVFEMLKKRRINKK